MITTPDATAPLSLDIPELELLVQALMDRHVRLTTLRNEALGKGVDPVTFSNLNESIMATRKLFHKVNNSLPLVRD